TRGIVVLSGTVLGAEARSSALEHVLRVAGVRAVVELLQVVAEQTNDAQIRARIEQRLRHDPLTEYQTLSVSVEDGVVSLSGSVRSVAERDLARQAAESVRGVRAVDNRIALSLSAPISDDEIAAKVASALAADQRIKGAQVAVRVSGGTVLLSGETKGEFEKRLARELAWRSEAHAVLDDELRVVRTREHLRSTDEKSPSDHDVGAALLEALQRDPRLDVEDIEVSVLEGAVTLSGTVPEPAARAAAESDARNTVGVRAVENRLRVLPPQIVSDAELLRNVDQRLRAHPGITPSGMKVFVENGWVLLSGSADSAYERERAQGASHSVRGVVGVLNELEVQRGSRVVGRDDRALLESIQRELRRDPRVTPALVRVEVRDGVAVLNGRLPDWTMHDAVLENVFETLPLGIVNHLVIVEPSYVETQNTRD
ncbi:MAG TPA: BON domain-containing protein, partial [Polyangiaceae bacterium]